MQIEELLKEMRKDIKEMSQDITEIKISSAKRDSKLFLVMAIFGAIGGAAADFIKRKWIG